MKTFLSLTICGKATYPFPVFLIFFSSEKMRIMFLIILRLFYEVVMRIKWDNVWAVPLGAWYIARASYMFVVAGFKIRNKSLSEHEL